jgi:hypothetical protein
MDDVRKRANRFELRENPALEMVNARLTDRGFAGVVARCTAPVAASQIEKGHAVRAAFFI